MGELGFSEGLETRPNRPITQTIVQLAQGVCDPGATAIAKRGAPNQVPPFFNILRFHIAN